MCVAWEWVKVGDRFSIPYQVTIRKQFWTRANPQPAMLRRRRKESEENNARLSLLNHHNLKVELIEHMIMF